jgi:uncharacterized protein (TIGR00251 family)
MDAVKLPVTVGEDHCSFEVRVVPRSRRDEITGLYGEALKIRLTAPPVDGKANRALVELLADRLSVPRAAIEIISGHASRHKVVRVSGVSADQVQALREG